MNIYQRQVGDICELTHEGVAKIGEYENNYTETTRPITSEERDWSAWNMTSLWIGMMVSIPVYQVASGLIVSGMAWYQALFTIVLGHSIVMIPAVMIGHCGTKFGLNYPMMSKLIFGIKGTTVPTLVRAILGCFWFGVQAWIGGQAINTIISLLIPSWNNMGFTGMFISFIIFWAMNVYIAASGSKAVKALENYAAPVLIALSFAVILWALYVSNWSMTKLLSEPSIQGNGSNFWVLFFPALSSMIAFDGGIALSMPDFTRHSKSQKSQLIGQLTGAPIMTAFIAFVGICGTGGSAIAFGEAIWEPAVLVSKFDNPFVVILFSIFIIMAVLTTNVAANLIPPTNVFSTLFAKKLSYKKATLVAAVLALFAQPWNALANANSLIFNVCGILGALLGPITGLYVVAYWFEHKRNIDLVELFREDGGKYNYTNGWNKEIIFMFVIATVLVLLGKYIPSMRFIFDNSYVIGSIGTGALYYIYLRLNKRDKFMEMEANHGEKVINN